VSSFLRPHQHSIGYMRDGFYRSKDPTNSIKVLKEMLQKRKKTTKSNLTLLSRHSPSKAIFGEFGEITRVQVYARKTGSSVKCDGENSPQYSRWLFLCRHWTFNGRHTAAGHRPGRLLALFTVTQQGIHSCCCISWHDTEPSSSHSSSSLLTARH